MLCTWFPWTPSVLTLKNLKHYVKGYTYDPRHRSEALEWDRARRSGELRMTLAWVAEVAALTEIFLGDDASLPRLDPQLRGKLARDELYNKIRSSRKTDSQYEKRSW